ncbi:MAG: ABC transporter permease [Actinomycetota bacterium]|nr:ABC transporter permease [Actinomycetota bacterium]
MAERAVLVGSLAPSSSKEWVPALGRLALGALSVTAAFVAWELASRASGSPLMPSIGSIVGRLADDVDSGLIWFHARITLGRGLTGFALATVAGITLGVLMARNRWIDAAIEPLLAATYPIPKLALYPVFLFTFGIGPASKIAIVALECLYPIAYNTYQGVRSIDRQLVHVAENAGAGRLRKFRDVFLPGALPSILAGIRTAMPIMLVLIVVTELLGESRGLGFLIRFAGSNFEPDGALAVVLFLGIIGFIFDRLIVVATRLLVFWERGVRL